MPDVLPTSKCPKYCPKQCENCPCPAVVTADIPLDLMDEFIEAAYEESRAIARSKTPRKTSKVKNNPGRADDCSRIPLTVPIAIEILKNWYREISFETEDALYDIKCIWICPDDAMTKKLRATNRLFIYYLLIMAIYVIHLCFVIDEKLFEVLCKILNTKDEYLYV